ncbi:hypothetical protein BDY17DRAFT_302753 [Neohortaea acidophila]|uniref:Fungal-specific transcription factor domain-containing protein n=1 Tax=Neohortaea acidophila TaxID=245834 RepID=A0A6A6PIG9_9PEZI|nr:uncharacterized protein BDY17DRAFT_302753 [Neohortaea acidophila]KAF2479830.1 hypothetical protein BDY17DRAFT_302753 [Neohortaea acidophila]
MESHPDPIPASESTPHALQCRICHRTFGRVGHLKRHERTAHSSSRPYACPKCSRTFSRRDALTRHEQSHLDTPTLLQQGSRACTLCANAKTRCSGGLPCKRCHERGFGCVYPSSGAPEVMQTPQNEPARNDLTMPLAPPLPLEDFMTGMTGVDGYLYHDWDAGFFHETNWLEAPTIGSDVNLSPLSSIFLSYSEATGSFEDASLTHASAEEVQPPVEAEGEEERTASEEDVAAETTRSGEYYVDGESARLPRVRRRVERKASTAPAQPTWAGAFTLHLPDDIIPTDIAGSYPISDNNYRWILGFYNRLCRLDSPLGVTFADHDLPSKSAFEALAALCCEKFVPHLPFLHSTTISNSDRHYLLDLALAAIGSQYTGNASLSVSMHEFTRRCLLMSEEDPSTPTGPETDLAAALLLNIIGGTYCGDLRLRRYALQTRSKLTFHFDRLRGQIEQSLVESNFSDSTSKWRAWIVQESCTRLAFSIWLVDTMLVTHCDSSPTFRLESVPFSLPCADALWQCENADTWEKLYKAQQSPTTLMDTLQKLYYNKRFSIKHTEFVRVLTIHGLFHRLWEVERYYSGTLSHWEPSSARQSGAPPFAKVSPWLPAVAAFKTWQNSSCDALDVLHWQANSTIGQMRGLEHPTVLHLHFARVVLLCPTHDIIALARHLTSTNTSHTAISRDEVNKATNLVRRWAVHHQPKARLAAIHAGTTFWHIRRHGTDAFHEAPALGLATLVLWAFSFFTSRKSNSVRTTPALPNPADPSLAVGPDAPDKHLDSTESGDIILLDRPTDDELVQAFVRNGTAMRPFMSGVGEVFAPGAPPRILGKGVDLLRHQGCWGGGEWTTLLESMQFSRRLDARSH